MNYRDYLSFYSNISYSNNVDYRKFLNDIQLINMAFSSFDFSNRHFRSFMASLEILEKQMTEAYELWLQIGLLRGINKLSPQGLKQNKYAQIFNIESVSLLRKVSSNLQELGKQINQQFVLCENQARKVFEKVKNKPGGKEFGSVLSNFGNLRNIAKESLFDSENVMLGSYFSSGKSTQAHKITDEVMGQEFDNIKGLVVKGQKIDELKTTVTDVKEDVSSINFSAEELAAIQSGVLVIKNVRPARLITTSKNAVEQLKNSEKLRLNLKIIDYFIRFYNEKTEKLKFGREIAKLVMILEDAIKQENENNKVFGENYNDAIKITDLIEEVVRIYNDMIDGKERPEAFSDAIQKLTQELALQQASVRQTIPNDVGNYKTSTPIPELGLEQKNNYVNETYKEALEKWNNHMNAKRDFGLNQQVIK